MEVFCSFGVPFTSFFSFSGICLTHKLSKLSPCPSFVFARPSSDVTFFQFLSLPWLYPLYTTFSSQQDSFKAPYFTIINLLETFPLLPCPLTLSFTIVDLPGQLLDLIPQTCALSQANNSNILQGNLFSYSGFQLSLTAKANHVFPLEP